MTTEHKPHSERVQGLRNLRQGYDPVAAVGFWNKLHGEDLIDVYADLVEQYEGALATIETLESKEELSALIASQTEEIESLEEQLEAAREQLAAPRHVTALRVGIDWHAHEGMVTVYDRDGRYMGCMGVERFARLVAEDAISRGSNPASRPIEVAPGVWGTPPDRA